MDGRMVGSADGYIALHLRKKAASGKTTLGARNWRRVTQRSLFRRGTNG